MALAVACCLLFAPIAQAEELDQPPQAPILPAPSNVVPPSGQAPPSPEGVTPHEPSKPPSDYVPEPTPTVNVTGGVDLPLDGDRLRLDADSWRVDFENGDASVVTARGNVRATYRDFSATASTAQVDLRTKDATFSGNVVLVIDGQEIRGDEVGINLDTRQWRFESAKSTVVPERIPEYIHAPVYLSGAVITGEAGKIIHVENGGFTTCNLDHPHYFINAGSATVWTDRKLVARDTTLVALGRTILKLSRLAIPIKQLRNRTNFIPLVGQTAAEGFYMKAAYGIAAGESNSANLLIDLMSKKGVGVGVNDQYNFKTGAGNLNLYQLYDQTTDQYSLTGRLAHEQRLGTVKMNLTSDYRSHSYQYSPQSTSLLNELRFDRQRTGASTQLLLRDSLETGFGRYDRITSNLSHFQQFGEKSRGTINLDYFRSENPFFVDGATISTANSQLTSRLDYETQEKAYDWAVRYARIDDLSDEAFISSVGPQFAGTERLPELELTSTSQRLGVDLPLGLTANTGFSVGRYREDLGRVEDDRAVADISIPGQKIRLADKLDLRAGAGFRQYFYSDGAAQYSIDTALGITRTIGEKSSAALDYRYLRPRGFTPFRFDFIGKYNTLTGRFNLQETERVKLSLYSGYNFDQDTFPWQDITARMTYKPSERYLIYTSTGYDLNRSQWRSLVNQFRVRYDNDFKVDLGTRYDIVESKLASVRGQLDTPMGKLWRLRANAGYNGYTSNFDYTNVQIVRDLHCWEATLTYVNETGFWQDKGIRLNFRIKAFPLFDSFGVGQFGQRLDSSVGEVL